jgi:CRP-like cAMP-binding protein
VGDGRHSADVRVIDGPAELIEVDGDAFLRALLFDADLAMELLALLSQRCQRSNQVIGLLLDGITAAAQGDGEGLAGVRAALQPINPGLAAAAGHLARLGSDQERGLR